MKQLVWLFLRNAGIAFGVLGGVFAMLVSVAFVNAHFGFGQAIALWVCEVAIIVSLGLAWVEATK